MTIRLLILSCIMLSGCARNDGPVSIPAYKTVDLQIAHSAATLSQMQFSLHQTGTYAIHPASPAVRSPSILKK